MGERSEFLKDVRAAVEHLFAHRKSLRRVAVRFQFRPEGLVISANITARNNEEMHASRQEIITWDRLETIDPAEFIGIVDQVCEPSHDRLKPSGNV
jgi:hypothetical protein